MTELDLFRHQTEPWSDSGMPRDLYKNSVETVWFHMSHIAMPHDAATAGWIHQTGFDTKNLYKFFAALHAEFEQRDDLDWEMGGATADKLDKFLEWNRVHQTVEGFRRAAAFCRYGQPGTQGRREKSGIRRMTK